MPAPTTKTTLWIWPTGLFPRRLLYFFRLKHITLHTLTASNIHLIPVTLVSSPPSLASLAGHEARPPNTSLPVLRIVCADGREVWIRESLSILTYFEELFGAPDGWPDLRGTSLDERAQTGDVVSLLDEAMHWSLVALIHSDAKTLSWTGLGEGGMSRAAAAHAHGKLRFCLDRLEGWIRDDERIVERKTVAGVVLLAQVEYHEMVYGGDWVEGCVVLRAWVEKMKRERWFVGSEVLGRVEEGEGWEVVLGD